MRLVLFAIGITISSLGFILQQKQMRESGMSGISFSAAPSQGWNAPDLGGLMGATLAQGRAFIGMEDPSDPPAANRTGSALPQIQAPRVPMMQVAGMNDPEEMARMMQDVEKQILNSPSAKMVETMGVAKKSSGGARFVKVQPRN